MSLTLSLPLRFCDQFIFFDLNFDCFLSQQQQHSSSSPRKQHKRHIEFVHNNSQQQQRRNWRIKKKFSMINKMPIDKC
ncbi:hypothetical protein DERP_010507 [Dermatophagoides pteronyssinus]|uniref:Uncharacterized protein n=1 Tax=Dermatophagoides pteronyssinus TaxID=6956 RepID=A0ABQ8JFG4_DERPT|nr:hypothetical protein DERP_010507 [Dermatophagoides pteronyssinus]